MRKSLWLIPVLFTALGSTSARADTIVASGGNVTAIDGITIAGVTYNVTFGTTDDMTFAGNATNASMANADIVADLSSDTYLTAGGVCGVVVDGGSESFIAFTEESPCGYGGPAGKWYPVSSPTSYYTGVIQTYPGTFLWDEFTVAPTSTPEPGTLSLTLTGVGLLGLTLILRKRKAHDLAQTT
jgi:hypothetical protein